MNLKPIDDWLAANLTLKNFACFAYAVFVLYIVAIGMGACR